MWQGDAARATLERQPGIRVSLLGHLIASGPRASSWREELRPGLATAAGHLALFLALFLTLPARPATDAPPETLTYLDIPPPVAAASPRAVLPVRPPVVRQGLRIPAVLSQVAQPGKLAGFQELLPPSKLAGLPPVEAGQAAVNPLDYTGRGVAGGVAGGEKPKEIPAPTDSTPVEMGAGPITYDVAVLHEPPVLLNRADLPVILRDLYPPLLRVAGLGGPVSVECVVDATGRVHPGTIRILSSPHPDLSLATRAALSRFRFRPGRVVVEGHTMAVAVLVKTTIDWTLREGGSR